MIEVGIIWKNVRNLTESMTLDEVKRLPLIDKIYKGLFIHLDNESIKEVLLEYHFRETMPSESLLNQLVKLIQDYYIAKIMYTISWYRVHGENVIEENLLSFIAKTYPNYAKMGAEFFYPMFREMLRIDPIGERSHFLVSPDELVNFIQLHKL